MQGQLLQQPTVPNSYLTEMDACAHVMHAMIGNASNGMQSSIKCSGEGATQSMRLLQVELAHITRPFILANCIGQCSFKP
jgi:hypothetical protein